MNPSDERLKNILVLVAVGCVFAYMADISWLKWSDMVIDSGREIYLPKALAGGRLLYRDIHYVYGPFSPYFNALLYKIFGVGVVTIGVGGLVNVALALLLVYVFAKFYVDRWMALLVTLSFLLIYPFGFYSGANIFNYVIPYSYPAVHSLLFSLAGFIFFRKWLADGSGRSGALAGFFLFLTGITKVEVALWLLAGLSFGFILKGKRERRGFFHLRTGSAKYVLLPVAAAALVYGSFKFAAWDSGGASPSLLELMKSNLLMPRGSFASGLFWGKEDFMETLKTLGAASAVMAGGGILAVGCGAACQKVGEPWPKLVQPLAAAVSGALMVVAAFWRLGLNPDFLFSPLFLFCLLGLGLSLQKRFPWGDEEERIFTAAFSVFAFLMLLRILFNTSPGSFGFYLSVPAFLVFLVIAFRILPEIVGTIPGKFLKTLVATTLVWFSVVIQQDAKANLDASNAPFPTPYGTLYFWDPPRVAAYREMAAVLSNPAYVGKTLVVFPEGLWLNFATGLDNPLFNYQYLPVDFHSPEDFDRLKAEFELKKPDFFAVVDRQVVEYGFRTLDEYAGPLRDYVFANYVPLARFSDRVILFRRK